MRLVDADVLEGLIDLALVDTIDEEHRYTKTAQNIVSGARLAKDVIKLAPTIEPSGDLISREDALRELNGACSTWQDDSKVAEIISAMPSASDIISRADAMAYPLSWEHYDKENGSREFICGVESYREYIDALPSAETHDKRTETHGVCLISKDDAMGAVQDHFNAYGFKGYDDGQKMMDRIKALPSAESVSREEYESMKRANEFNMRMCSEVEHELHDLKQKQAEAVQGEWVKEEEYGDLCVCDQCGFASEYKTNFCPTCGARMKGGDSE